MTIFRNDIKRVFTSPIIYSMSALLIAAAVVNYIRNKDLLAEFQSSGTLNVFIYGVILIGGGIICVILPLVAVIPYSASIAEDMNTGFMKNQLLRISISRYAWQKIMSTALSGSSVFIIAFILYYIAAYIYDPSPSYRLNLNFAAFSSLYYYSMPVFCIIISFSISVLGASYALLGLGLGAIWRKKYIVYAVPAFLYHASFIVGWLFPPNIRQIIFSIIPTQPVQFDNIQSIAKTYLDSLIIAGAGITLTLYGLRKYLNG